MTPTTIELAFLLAALTLPAAPAPDDPCSSEGHCHLPRWNAPVATSSGLFGRAIASDGGECVVVGEPGADRAHVYRRQGLDWQLVQTLDGPADSLFGRAVDMTSTRLVVGAPQDDVAAPNAGAAYVYELVGNSFTLVETLVSTMPADGDAFGDAVGITTQWAAVGAPQAAAGGRVETFARVAGNWNAHDLFTNGASGSLGDALTMDGDVLAIGEWTDTAFGPNSGVVHFMRLLPAGLTNAIELRPAGLGLGDQFGWSLDLDNGRLVVGAPGDDDLASNAGAAYVFEQVSVFVSPFVDFDEVDTLQACRASANAGLGWSVAIDGERAAVGAKALGVAGTVYTFERLEVFGETWPVADEIRPADGATNDWFGSSLALAGTVIFVGAQFVDDPTPNEGALYVVSTNPLSIAQGACPCEHLAGHAPYGTGKAGLAGVPVLELARELVPGETTLARALNLTPGTLPVLLWGLQPALLPFDDGFLGMADPNLIPMPAVGALGQVGKNLVVPPGTCGLVIALQVMVLDPGASGPVGSAQSNAIYAVIGY